MNATSKYLKKQRAVKRRELNIVYKIIKDLQVRKKKGNNKIRDGVAFLMIQEGNEVLERWMEHLWKF